MIDFDDYNARAALYKAVVERYGAEHQLMKAVEEMAELTKAICDYRQLRCHTVDVATEIADVFIMLEQLQLIFDCEDIVQAELKNKLNRLCRVTGFKGGMQDGT